MTDSSDRLDRIEAALDQLRQRQEATQAQIEAQIPMAADLRTSVVELRAMAEALLQAIQIHQQHSKSWLPRCSVIAVMNIGH